VMLPYMYINIGTILKKRINILLNKYLKSKFYMHSAVCHKRGTNIELSTLFGTREVLT
jgi:hypothetical protein